jgi:hypothetical protein
MDGTAINAIAELVRKSASPIVVDFEGNSYLDRQVFAPPIEKVETMRVHTLAAIKHLVDHPMELQSNGVVVHVAQGDKVDLIGGLERTRRQVYATATFERPEVPGWGIGQFHALETAIIALQALYLPSPDREAILRVLGNVQDGAVKTSTDDGVSQTVTARTGIVKVGDVDVPNPVILRPMRTFPEIEQPESRYLFRMRSAKADGSPTVALFQADGGAWELEAINRIAEWFRSRGVPVIA